MTQSPQLDRLDQLVREEALHECEGFGATKVCVRLVAVAQLPTRFGTFRIAAFWNNRDEKGTSR